MQLSNNEKKLLKIMATVFVISGIILYFVFQEPEIKNIPSSKKDPQVTSERVVVSSGGGGGTRGGGSSSGGSSLEASGSISIGTFESHNTEKSCWVLIEGDVYDITGYLQNSINAETIALYCGTFGFKEGYLSDSAENVEDVVRQSISMGKIG